MKKILIHTCCADCLLNSVNYLKKKKLIDNSSKIVSLFYNPNIHPRSEYLARLKAVKKVIGEDIRLVVPDYKPKEHITAIKNLTRKDRRCSLCWDLRIKFLFNYAKENEFDVVTTTLLTSPYQNRKEILEIGKKYEKEYGIKFLKVGSEENCKNVGFYKQNYCGCCFSLVEKMLMKDN